MENGLPAKRVHLNVRDSLGSRFSLFIFFVLISVNICSLFYIYTKEDTRNRQDLKSQGKVIGNFIATSVTPHLLHYDYIALDAALGEAMHLQGLHYTAILASNEIYVAGDISEQCLKHIHSSGIPVVQTKKDQIANIQKLRHKDVDHLDISTPILFGDTYLGRVVVGLSLEISRKKTRDFLAMLLVVNGVVALLLAGAIYYFFWKKALQPIYLLIDGANRVANGNLDEAVPLSNQDEIGLLTESFNTMMTSRKTAEEESHKSRRDWERLFNAVDDVVTIQDNDTRILQANAAAGRLLNIDPKELIGKHCYEILRGKTQPCPDCPVILCQHDHTDHHADMKYPELDITCHISAFPLFDDKEGWVGIAHIARDISKQKKLEAQYRQVQKMEAIGTLAGGIAHDFNNILTPIFGYAQLIKMEVQPGSQLENNIDQILKSSQLAQQLVKQILTFSRERSHAMEELRIQPVIKESMKLLRASIPTTIEFKLEIDMNSGNILADPTQIHQIIMNLCTNAFHAMEESGGTLGISLKQTQLDRITAQLKGNLTPGEYLELRISDTGAGMNAATLEHIFEPFFTTKEEGKGTGMGLSVVHGIVKEHGGAIFAYSEPGSGSTFTIYLPVAPSSDTPEKLSRIRKDTKEFPGGDEHIMVLDDEKYVVSLEKRLLEDVGYQVSTFTVVSQALDVFKKHPETFDLVITDMTMPKMTGLEFAEQLVAIRPDIQVILCTGHSHITMKELQVCPAIQSYLAKPINLHQLAESVRETLDCRKKYHA